MTEQVKLERSKKDHKDNTRHCHGALYICHACSSAFFCDGKCLKGGFGFYLKAISTSYVLSALKVTLIATDFCGSYQYLLWNMDSVAVDQVFV